MKPIKLVSNFLNSITMYRLLVYGLSAIAVISVLFSLLHILTLPVSGMLASLVSLLAVSYLVNRGLAYAWRAPYNTESWLITALILFFILPPANTAGRLVAGILVAVIAMASKYMLAIKRSHVFNPAAIAVVIVGFIGSTHASWWVGSKVLFPITLAFGFMVLYKIRRITMFMVFVATALAVTVFVAAQTNYPISSQLWQFISSSPLIFLGTIMLTEPATLASKRRDYLIFAVIVGALFASQIQTHGYLLTAEIALVLGNIYSYAVSPKYQLILRLQEKQQLSEQVYNFVFTSAGKARYEAGQYLEWTLPHKSPDDRGNRRSFSLASSPTEDTYQLGAKFYQPSSTYKNALLAMKVGDTLVAGHVSGDFTLPKDPAKKLVFIAGGIGITPFRSMIKYLIDSGQKRDIVLFYSVSSPTEVSYADILKAAIPFGIHTVLVLGGKDRPAGWNGAMGRIDEALIKSKVPDFAHRDFYMSGPNAMVQAYRKMVTKMGISRKNITTDYFSGY